MRGKNPGRDYRRDVESSGNGLRALACLGQKNDLSSEHITLGCRPLANQGLEALLLLAGDRYMLWRTAATHSIRMPGFAFY